MNGSIDHWADQAIDRSGILGAFDFYRELANHQAFLSDYTSFEAGDARRFGSGPLESMLGPSYSMIAKTSRLFILEWTRQRNLQPIAYDRCYRCKITSSSPGLFDLIEREGNDLAGVPERRG